MATAFTKFAPTNTSLFQFQPTFDGEIYTVIATWSLFGRRYYLNCYTLSGVLVFAMPMIGSPADADISITGGYFTTQLIWRPTTGNFEVIDA